MAFVSLILPTAPMGFDAGPWRLGLERAGHQVEVLVVDDRSPSGSSWAADLDASPGLASAAVIGLRHSAGEILVVMDPGAGYEPSAPVALVASLEAGQADLAIATRGVSHRDGTPRARRGLVGVLLKALLGTSAPASGLIGMTRRALDDAGESFRPIGGTFAFELLARVPGRRVEVPVLRAGPRAGRRRPEMDDVRQWKRLADERFGNKSRLIQYCAVGGSGVIVDLACFLTLQPILAATGLASLVVAPSKVRASLFVARVGAIAVALCWNFLLNRRLTFSYARSGSIVRQFATYALGNAPGIALNLLTFFGLTRKVAFFDEHRLAAALIGIVVATGISFPMSRWVAFKDRSESEPPTPADPAPRKVRDSSAELAAPASAPRPGR